MTIILVIVLLTAILILKVSKRGRTRIDCRSFFSGAPFAHRGAFIPGFIPENSLSAFDRACTLGYGIELDVRAARDGRLCVMHDRNIQRMTGCDAFVESLDLKALKAYHLDGTEETIPSLSEALKVIAGRVPIIIEMKSNGFHERPDRMAELLVSEMKNYHGSWCAESFDPRILSAFKQLKPSVPIGQLSEPQPLWPIGPWLHGKLLCCLISRPDFIAYRIGSSVPHWLKIKKQGLPLIAWTVHSKNEWKQVKKVYDAYIFEGFLPCKDTDEIE